MMAYILLAYVGFKINAPAWYFALVILSLAIKLSQIRVRVVRVDRKEHDNVR